MDRKTWEFGYLVEPNYRMVEDWLFTILLFCVDDRIPVEIRAAKDLTDELRRLGD